VLIHHSEAYSPSQPTGGASPVVLVERVELERGADVVERSAASVVAASEASAAAAVTPVMPSTALEGRVVAALAAASRLSVHVRSLPSAAAVAYGRERASPCLCVPCRVRVMPCLVALVRAGLLSLDAIAHAPSLHRALERHHVPALTPLPPSTLFLVES